jgi:hypothetical protein
MARARPTSSPRHSNNDPESEGRPSSRGNPADSVGLSFFLCFFLREHIQSFAGRVSFVYRSLP